MKKFVQNIIKTQAKHILAKYKPTVIAVTGSVGKTSTKNAIATVLDARFRIRAPKGSYNNEFGVPLTVIGMVSPGHSVRGWLRVMWQAQRLLWKRDPSYPTVLMLEYGADKPGDIGALCAFAPPDIAVWTAISPVHLANYPSLKHLAEEKAEIIRRVKPNGLAIVNADDATVAAMKSVAAVPVRTYGFSALADVRAEGYAPVIPAREAYAPGERFASIQFDVVAGGDCAEVVMRDTIGKSQVSAALAATAVGLHLGLPLQEIVGRLAEVKSEPGRLHPLPGIKGCLILDDSYNAAPASVAAALEVLGQWPVAEQARRIAVLGVMAELGPVSEQEHRLAGMHAATTADILVVSGEAARGFAHGAVEAGMDEMHVIAVQDSTEAGRWLDAHVKTGDVVLVKGSQSARMEKAVKDILAEPDKAGELLCRQYGGWLEE